MYKHHAETKGWKVEVLDMNATELGGFKEIILGIEGEGAYRELQYESGGHRVQRVPETETKGRIHTSAATVAVLPEPEDVEIDLKPDDYRKDIFCASGPGGQHVNKTASAIRLTHLETGIVVQCQDEKSQHKNFAKALRVLKTRLYEAKRQEEHDKRASERKTLVGSGDRSQRIRTYNFPENRVTDHRINLTLYKLDSILAGNVQPLTDALVDYDRQQQRDDDGHRRVTCIDWLTAATATLATPAHGPMNATASGAVMADEWTIGRLLQWTADYLKQHGSESPRLDAEVLLAHARGCQRIELYTSFDDPASDELRTKFRELVRRRAEGMPVAYLVGPSRILFARLSRHARRADSAARDRIAGADGSWIGSRPAAPADRPIEVADVGTGSGIIAITVARYAPRGARHGHRHQPGGAGGGQRQCRAAGRRRADRIRRKRSVGRDCSPTRSSTSLPAIRPTSARAEMADLPRDVKAYEPELALAAGPTGTSVIERLIPQAAERLQPGGSLLLEISPMLQQRVEALIAADERLQLGPTIKDLAGLARVVQATRK